MFHHLKLLFLVAGLMLVTTACRGAPPHTDLTPLDNEAVASNEFGVPHAEAVSFGGQAMPLMQTEFTHAFGAFSLSIPLGWEIAFEDETGALFAYSSEDEQSVFYVEFIDLGEPVDLPTYTAEKISEALGAEVVYEIATEGATDNGGYAAEVNLTETPDGPGQAYFFVTQAETVAYTVAFFSNNYEARAPDFETALDSLAVTPESITLEPIESEQAVFELEPYTHPSGAFSLDVPVGWETLSEGDVSVTFGFENDLGQRSTIGVVFTDAGEVLDSTGLQTFIDTIVDESIGGLNPEYDILGQTTQDDGSIYVEASAELAEGDEITFVDSDFLFSQRENFVFTLFFISADYFGLVDTWDAVIASYVINEEALPDTATTPAEVTTEDEPEPEAEATAEESAEGAAVPAEEAPAMTVESTMTQTITATVTISRSQPIRWANPACPGCQPTRQPHYPPQRGCSPYYGGCWR